MLKLFNTILWASDGGADDHQVVYYVGELCDHYCCELRIVHVVQTILPEPLPQRSHASIGSRGVGRRWTSSPKSYAGQNARVTIESSGSGSAQRGSSRAEEKSGVGPGPRLSSHSGEGLATTRASRMRGDAPTNST